MNILIIGSEGFIGRHAVQYFLSKGHEVVGCDIVYTPSSTDYTYLKLDAFSLDYSTIFAAYPFNFCLNLAGSANVSFSFENPELDFNSNVYAVHRILNAIRLFNPHCRLINISSAAVYGNPSLLPVQETDPTGPLSPYGWHKLQAENLCKEYYQIYQVKSCNLRIFSAFGPYLKKQLFWDLFNKSIHQTEIEVYGTGEETRDFIFIADIMQVFEKVMDSGKFEAEVLNVANGSEIKIRDAVAVFFQLLNPKQRFYFNGKVRKGDPLRWRAEISNIKKLGYVQQVSFEDGLSQYVLWLKEELK